LEPWRSLLPHGRNTLGEVRLLHVAADQLLAGLDRGSWIVVEQIAPELPLAGGDRGG
jgi:hypothetical protein